MDQKQIVDQYFRSVDQHVRPASVATLSTDVRGLLHTSSCFGGTFGGRANEQWPVMQGRPLEGVLQINVSELPYVPDALRGVAIVQVYASWKVSRGAAAYDGGPWTVRTHASLDGLVPLVRPFQNSLRPCRIAWRRVDNEPPHYPDDIDLIDDGLKDAFEALEGSDQLYIKRYTIEAGTKVGGWPYSLQNGAVCGQYILQVGSEEKAKWMWGPDGNAFFGMDQQGHWRMSWDFL